MLKALNPFNDMISSMCPKALLTHILTPSDSHKQH